MTATSYPTWAQKRLLRFLNTARSAEAIHHHPELRNDPNLGNANGYVIGEKVAQNIMQFRRERGFRPFRSLDDILAIKGLGDDKLNDLLYSFSKSADAAFEERLFEQVLQENWELQPQSTESESLNDFIAIADNRDNFRRVVAQLYAKQRFPNHSQAQRQLEMRIQQASVESYFDAHLGAFQFAFWWYLFDYDNWFSYEVMRDVCERYLNYHGNNDRAMQFRMIRLTGYDSIYDTQRDLLIPVVVNFTEQKITVWMAQLND
ncbi:MAG: ComEA family DNA-binding protein [Saprospiraceae bacterium]